MGSERSRNDIIQRTRVACCLSKAKNTHIEYVILIAFSKANMFMWKLLNIK